MATVRELRRDERNRRKHNGRNIGMIVNALQEVGAARSIVIDEDGTVLAGNGVVEAAAEAGIDRVQIVDADGQTIIAVRRRGLTDEQKRRLALFDNRTAELADWDTEQIAADLADGLTLDGLFTADELAALLDGASRPAPKDEPEAHLDRADELQAKWDTARGQIWLVPSVTVPGGVHRVMCGDATSPDDVGALMAGAQAEMVWTDPPYGVAIGDKNKYLNTIARSNRVEDLVGDTLDEAGLVALLEQAFDCAIAHCTPGAAWYVAAPPGPLQVLFGQALKERGIWRQTIQWVKDTATFSPMGVDYHWQAEPIFYGWLPNAGHRYYGGRKQTTVWEIDRPTKSPEHPTMKPVELVARAVENSSRRGEIVLDVFLGSGTTVLAAESLARLAYGMEIEPKYLAVTLERLAEAGLAPERPGDVS